MATKKQITTRRPSVPTSAGLPTKMPAAHRREYRRQQPDAPCLLLSPEQCAGALQVSRTTIFEMIGRGELRSIVVGAKSRRVPLVELERYIRQQLGEDGDDGGNEAA